MTPRYVIQRGETVSIVVEALAGAVADVLAVSAKMKRVVAGRHTLMPGPEVAVAATFTVVPAPPTAEFLGGWYLNLSAAQTAALSAGIYLADASFTTSDRVIIDGPVLIEVQNSAVAA